VPTTEELQSPLIIGDAARAERLARQVERMAAHLELRETAVQDAEARADALYSESRLLRERISELEIALERAERAYSSVMASKTMRWLRGPRALYAHFIERRETTSRSAG
jgi:hypothetical protein